ncbi:multidrug effflux MFS transporter [Xylophilus sp.]|uniref:multidrug effflux MFS transporter n=1 Tax=Xylophilus sp. TaxID=2653893 RepID=UPI003FCCFDF2
MAMHVFVPALPAAARDLHAGVASVQLTISLYILGMAIGQLFYGPLSDRFGRRPVLMGGLVLYTVAGLGAAFAPDVHSLVAARLLQAFGGCAGLALGRAMVRDTSAPQAAAQRLALMNLMTTIGPGLAPLIGAAVVGIAGWRAIFALFTVAGAACIWLTWRLVPETARPSAQLHWGGLARNYAGLLRSPAFLGYAVGGGCAVTSMYAFIALAPFVFTEQLHRPAYEVGFYVATMVSGIWLGSVAASRLIPHMDIGRLMVRGNALSVAGAFVLLAAALSGHLSVAATVGAMFVFTLGAGMAAPGALARAVSVNPKVIGSASGLYGFIQMAVGALCTTVAGLGHANAALSAALVLAAAGVVAQLAFWTAARYSGRILPA